ncbi:hypothetical protein BE221DRAFT_192383 [Ostreococcus tauri]|uniref:Uncharacterized protein n=1 Tax=Ostreococcus tauri TaxID=70448 RepID=A0A1Y5IH18_OSTTA|nr:hypothetical protein BE221DRAFT_192383 [Ostreococcus tauri]
MSPAPAPPSRVVDDARARNVNTASALASIWKNRCDALTRDLERARETFEEMKRELCVHRDASERERAENATLEREIQKARLDAKENSKASERLAGEIRALTCERDNVLTEKRDVEEALERAKSEASASALTIEMERAETLELLDGERRARASAEKRRDKCERAMKAMREDMEAREREFANELERERVARARLEEDRVELEADRRRFRDFEQMLAAEKIKVVEAHSSNKMAQQAMQERMTKAENEAAAMRKMMESRSTEMANAVRRLNEELAVQHDVVERGMSARVDALREAFDEEIVRVRERANVMIEAARKKETAANERVKELELTVSRAEQISRDALNKLKSVSAATVEAERECEQLRASLHSLGEINAKLTRRIIDGEPFVLDDEVVDRSGARLRSPVSEMSVNTPSPPAQRARKTGPSSTGSVRYAAHDIQKIHRELEAELAKLRVEHDAIAREIGASAAAEGEMLARALQDAQERMEAKARQVKLLNSSNRNAAP